MFTKFNLDFESDIFDELSKSTEFEDVTAGRQGGVLVNQVDDMIPIVRTTTNYHRPSQRFLPIHYDIMEKIKLKLDLNGIPLNFNNALIEIYDSTYRSMGYHSDQALDLDQSYIALFSSYDDQKDLRKLKVKDKQTHEGIDIVLDQYYVVLFSVETNRKYLHKIILDQSSRPNRWLGITFRQSKTFIRFHNELPYFISGVMLTLANDDQRREFYKYRKTENVNVEHTYPEMNYTISESDTMCVL